MKRIVLPLLIVLAAAGAAAFFLLDHKNTRLVRMAELLPPETLFFAEADDLPRTAQRWKQTDLCQLWQEPEVQGFLEKPRSKIPAFGEWEAKLAQAARVQPRQAFVAVTTLEGDSPRWIAGFSFAAGRAEVEKALAEPRAELRKAWPAGKADLIPYGASEIRTYTDKDQTIAEAFHDNWYFAANNTDLLRATLDRYESEPAGAKPALASDETYQKTLAPLPADGDLRIFGRIGVLTDRLASLLTAAGQPADQQQLADLKKMKAVAVCTKMDGKEFRDTLFAYSPGGGKQEPLARRGLAMTSATTLLYYAATLPASLGIPESEEASLAQMFPAFADLEKSLAANGLKFSDAAAAFGPELNSLFDWSPATLSPPSLLLAIDVRDSAKARAFIDALTATPPTAPGWTHADEDGATIFQPPPAQGSLLSIPTPSIALSDKFLVIGLSTDAVTNGLAQVRNQAPKLDGQPQFQAAGKTVTPPTAAFGYLDLHGLVERGYGIFRPFLAMSLAFNAESGQYLDAGKLPNTETLTKHLGVSVFSESATGEGTLFESTGSLTFNQAAIAALAGAGFAALPMIEQTLQNGGGLLPPNFLQPSPVQPGASPAAAPPASAKGAAVEPPPSQPDGAAPVAPAVPAPAPPLAPEKEGNSVPPAPAEKPNL